MSHQLEYKWSFRDYNLEDFVKNYKSQLPLVVKVTKGYCGVNDAHSFSAEDIIYISMIGRQNRNILLDSRKHFVSIPEHYPLLFHQVKDKEVCEKFFREGRDPKYLPDSAVWTAKPLDAIIDETGLGSEDTYVVPHKNSAVKFCRNVDEEEFVQLGLMKVEENFEEEFLIGFSLTDGRQLYHKPIAVPLNIPLSVNVAMGLEQGTEQDFCRVIQNLKIASIEHSSKAREVKGRQEIMLYDSNTRMDRNRYSYMAATQYLIECAQSKALKNQVTQPNQRNLTQNLAYQRFTDHDIKARTTPKAKSVQTKSHYDTRPPAVPPKPKPFKSDGDVPIYDDINDPKFKLSFKSDSHYCTPKTYFSYDLQGPDSNPHIYDVEKAPKSDPYDYPRSSIDVSLARPLAASKSQDVNKCSTSRQGTSLYHNQTSVGDDSVFERQNMHSVKTITADHQIHDRPTSRGVVDIPEVKEPSYVEETNSLSAAVKPQAAHAHVFDPAGAHSIYLKHSMQGLVTLPDRPRIVLPPCPKPPAGPVPAQVSPPCTPPPPSAHQGSAEDEYVQFDGIPTPDIGAGPVLSFQGPTFPNVSPQLMPVEPHNDATAHVHSCMDLARHQHTRPSAEYANTCSRISLPPSGQCADIPEGDYVELSRPPMPETILQENPLYGFTKGGASAADQPHHSISSCQAPSGGQPTESSVRNTQSLFSLAVEPQRPVRAVSPGQVRRTSESAVHPAAASVRSQIFTSIKTIPLSVRNFGIAEVSQCLHLLNLGKYVDVMKEQNVDGQLLVNMNENMLIAEFAFSQFHAMKLMKFAKEGWRPMESMTDPLS